MGSGSTIPPPFNLIGRALSKIQVERQSSMHANMASTSLVSTTAEHVIVSTSTNNPGSPHESRSASSPSCVEGSDVLSCMARDFHARIFRKGYQCTPPVLERKYPLITQLSLEKVV